MWLYVTLGVLAATAFGTLLWHRTRQTKNLPGMKEFAKKLVNSPEYGNSLSEYLAQKSRAIERAELAPPPHPHEFPRLIRNLLGQDEIAQAVANIRLQRAGALAEQPLLAALRSPDCTWDRPGKRASVSSPADRIVRLLSAIPSRQLGEALRHLVNHEDWQVNTRAIEACVADGTASAAVLAIEKMRAENVQVTAACSGVKQAFKRGWADEEFCRILLEWSEQEVKEPEGKPGSFEVSLFARLGGQSALEYLSSDQVLESERPFLISAALRVLNKRSIRLSDDVIEPLLARALESKDDWQFVFADALDAFANGAPEATLRVAESQLTSVNGRTRDVCVESIRRLCGLPQPWYVDPPPEMYLSPDEQKIVRVLRLVNEAFGEIHNGGISQYFFNSSGNEWPNHQEALREIGMPQTAEALKACAKMIAPGDLSLDRDVRIRRYASMTENEQKALDDRFRQRGDEDEEIAQLQFMRNHADLVRRIRQARHTAGLQEGPPFDSDYEVD